jgi:peptidoglycan/LPS O-acetylase OafA/YrhL
VHVKLADGGGDARPGGPADAAPAPDRGRVVALDSLRGLAALYVVVFHCRILTIPGNPANSPWAPSWLGWLMYGRLAVVFFLVLSGFSLAVPAADKGWRLGGLARYARRRAWRLLPPYWVALALSLVVAWAVVPASHTNGPPTGKSVIVYGLLMQDVTTAPTPNGAFWSIAVEVELSLVFPLFLLIRRRLGALALLAGVTLPVVALGLLAPNHSPVEGATGLTTHLAPVFVLGLVAAGVLTAGERIRRLPWPWLAVLTGVPVTALMISKGSTWTSHHSFWIDLAVGPAIAMVLVAVATGRPAVLVRLLAARPLRGLGTISYSLYLIHLPIIMVISVVFVIPRTGPGVSAFGLTLAFALPISLVTAWLFASVFEIPFQRHRSWTSLVAAARSTTRAARDEAATVDHGSNPTACGAVHGGPRSHGLPCCTEMYAPARGSELGNPQVPGGV